MEIFLVGGAVRDIFMGLEPKDEDFVVIGSTPEEMHAAGFEQVGGEFPVFLDRAGNEFALARLERKVGSGHKGFVTDHSPEVTLDEDLERRDFTMNAMAQMSDGSIHDPFNGRRDIKSRLIRHVRDESFVEDPLRVLRAARFAARFDFEIAPETMNLMEFMVKRGDLNELTRERVWKEVQRAMMEPHPHRFIEVLDDLEALEILFLDGGPVLVDSINFVRFLGSRKASEPVRWMAVFSDWGEQFAFDFAAVVGMPNVLRDQCVFASVMCKAFREENHEAFLNGVMVAFKRFRLDNDTNHNRFCTPWEAMMWMTHNQELAMVAQELSSAMREIGCIGFHNLSDEDQKNLQGAAISRKIDDIRRKRLGVIFQEN